jgi:excinuclease ABC subunit A
VASGTPEEVAKVARSYTGQFLKPLFKRGAAKAEMAQPKQKRARAAE